MDKPRRSFLNTGAVKLPRAQIWCRRYKTARACDDAPAGKLVWDFQQDVQGWEPWSQIDGFQVNAGELNFHTTGSDPFMASPFIEVRPRQLDHIEIRLRRAVSHYSTSMPSSYWQTADMTDFSDQARVLFEIAANNQPQMISLRLTTQGQSPLVRLRLDPGDAPAEIHLASITLVCR